MRRPYTIVTARGVSRGWYIMTLEPKKREIKDEKTAKEILADRTGRPESEFDASEYEIPDFEEQEIIVTESDS